ncbi:twin-arginine translocase subunit TatC [Thiohalorhabdus methylotrophus]|uniref:Sec-independent protein translocase protein TatC n=1 Tax=Thiohalorhabdus methylotrophus TaxID=3242694 RepID=A0ABV4TZ59_9GAMM
MTDPSENSDTLVGHLLELKSRLTRALAGVLVGFLAAYPFKERIFEFFIAPMTRVLPEKSSFIFTNPGEAFFTYLKVSLLTGFLLAIPVVMYQFWAFVAPGLYKNERRLFFPMLILSIFLFLFGAAFSFFLVFPLAFQFLVGFANDQIMAMPTMREYLGFSLTLILAFGASFEIPIVCMALVRLGMVTVDGMRAKRRYVFAGAFVLAALITPPDVISQLLLGFPVWLLYELGIVLSRYVTPQEEDTESAGEES